MNIPHPVAKNPSEITGSAFFEQAAAFNWAHRDSAVLACFESGAVPSFFFRFIPVPVSHKDSLGNTYSIVFYCSPDYLLVGQDEDWARVPITPMAAQRIANTLKCFLPTRKMVDLIYERSKVKLAPIPMYAFRDSTVTMWQHHLIIEGQRKGRKGLISGIKKDVVIYSEDRANGGTDRVAIYGWHQVNGKPIQPLYTGHVNWYVDYSHGIRFIYQNIRVNGKWMNFKDLFADPLLRNALSDETGVIKLTY